MPQLKSAKRKSNLTKLNKKHWKQKSNRPSLNRRWQSKEQRMKRNKRGSRHRLRLMLS